MAKITAKRLLKEDLQKDSKEALPTWVDPLIYVFNLFLEQVTQAFSRRLTFDENVRSQIYEFRVSTSANYSSGEWATVRFKWDFPDGNPSGVIILTAFQTGVNYTPLYAAVSCDWLYANGSIEVRYVSGLDNGKTYQIRVLVI